MNIWKESLKCVCALFWMIPTIIFGIWVIVPFTYKKIAILLIIILGIISARYFEYWLNNIVGDGNER